MQRLRPYILVVVFCMSFCVTLDAQERQFLKDTNNLNLIDSDNWVEKEPESIISISNNTILQRLLIESTEPISGEVEINISDTTGLLIQNASLNANVTRLVTYPTSMLATNVYMISCSIAGDVWNQMVYVP
jgi:hypothetical protein